MPALRAIRLLQSVEAGTTLGAAFETYLQDNGRLGEFNWLLSLRGHTKRIANNQLVLDAILLSPKAINSVFTTASASNNTAAGAMVASPAAMTSLSGSSAALTAIFENTTSRNLFTASGTYGDNVLSITTLLASLDPAEFTTKDLLFDSAPAMTAIFSDTEAAQSVVVNQDMLTRTAAQTVAVETIGTDSAILALFAPSQLAMNSLAANSDAMVELITHSEAVVAFAQNAVAMKAISSASAAWTTFKSSSFFAANLKDVIANIIGVTAGDFANVNAIIADASAMATLAESTPACEALASSSSAITTLASSSNLSIITGSANAMGVFGTETILGSFLAVPAATSAVFGSALANGVIVASNTLMDVVATTSSITDYLAGFATTAIPSNNNVVGSNNVFGGFPDKFITLSIRANNIGAIAMTHTLEGSPLAGTTYSNVVSSSGVVTTAVVVGLSAAHTWKASGIAATAAASPSVTYVDMTGAIG